MMLSSIKPFYLILICFVALWWYSAPQVPPLELLPPGPHHPISIDAGTGIYSGTYKTHHMMMNEHGITTIGIGVIENDGTECMIKIHYFYAGRTFCWDGRSNSFEETFAPEGSLR